MGTPSATLLTAPMFGLKLAPATGAHVLLLPLTRQCRTPRSGAEFVYVP
jgi:hypothetical protein